MTSPCTPPRLVDSTLREGDQFAGPVLRGADRLTVARALDAFGVAVIEHTSPAASPGAAENLRRLVALDLSAQVVAHVRCDEADVALALDCGVDGAHLFVGTSPQQRRSGHRRDPRELVARAGPAVRRLKDAGRSARLSCEDALRTPLEEVLQLCHAAEDLGVDRLGLADTVGVASPDQVRRLVGALRDRTELEIEFHGHDDAGCAVANTAAALEAGATHLDVTVLGIGERNGIASLSGLVARLWTLDPGLLAGLDLGRLAALDALVARRLGMRVPFKSCITGPTAFTHKAGVHTGAVLRDPGTYEGLDPSAFGRTRRVLLGHGLTGRHALAARAVELGVPLDEEGARLAVRWVKAAADAGPLGEEQVDVLLRAAGDVRAERELEVQA